MKVQIPSFEKAHVLIVDDVTLDRYWYGPSSRISPETSVPVVKVENIEERPGGGANVFINIVTLGDYLVNGGDNDPAKIPGNRCVWQAGGQVVIMDYVEGHSTTSTIARILPRL